MKLLREKVSLLLLCMMSCPPVRGLNNLPGTKYHNPKLSIRSQAKAATLLLKLHGGCDNSSSSCLSSPTSSYVDSNSSIPSSSAFNCLPYQQGGRKQAQDGDLLSFTRITWNALRDAKELKTIEDPVSLP
mmetsp:Transcript_10135/g.33778  ORF Transcript_10135/g.33778 Transcript_10135/m.33778 type:complete len:130 (-) Transcript_10135:107-496(-)